MSTRWDWAAGQSVGRFGTWNRNPKALLATAMLMMISPIALSGVLLTWV